MPKSSAIPRSNVVPDALDLRDRRYLPAVALSPAPEMSPRMVLPVLNQKETSACTGFALSNVVNFLQRGRDPKAPAVSPFMIYSMARRYDEFPGATADTGSSLRGAMKGWYRHGVCKASLWRGLAMPAAAKTPEEDWWLDAAARPLGAYYRVDHRSITDMHVALNEVGILYASAICHGGWGKGFGVKPAPAGDYWSIPLTPAAPDDGGHAFIIVGYNRRGFIIQNSWSEAWGSKGLALLSYEDWIEHAMDCWVAQLGVVTEQHKAIASAITVRSEKGKVQLAGDKVSRDRELSPFIVDMENNGRLSSSGRFRTQPGDVQALFDVHLAEARRRWGLGPKDAADIAIYAHGGLTGEDDAAETIAQWLPALYEARIFPIFLMWETDLWSTLKGRLADLVTDQPRATGGIGDWFKNQWNQRLERLLARPGTMIWGEMKQNAEAISAAANSGGRLLYQSATRSSAFDAKRDRLHLIGHSAGSIVHSYVVDRLGGLGWQFDSLNLMAPAVTSELFGRTVVPRLKSGQVKRLHEFHLTDPVELADPTCKPILGYSRSLLYLVSESFEHGQRTPILGMDKYFAGAVQGLSNVKVWASPGGQSQSSTHGGFDDDPVTRANIVKLIRQR